MDRSEVNRKETVQGRVAEPQAYEVGMPMSRGVYPQVPPQSAGRAAAQPAGEVVRDLARQKGSHIAGGPLQPAPVPMRLAIPPKYAGAQVVGDVKGQSALHIARM